jgi:peptide-methionine (R)-S-oxide reductase
MVDKPNYKKNLTPEQYEVCWNRGTEPPFSDKYHDCKDKGIYKCVCCDNSLYLPPTPNSILAPVGPAFGPINRGSVKEAMDKSYGMIRTEVMCARCGAHLGHVFADEPEPTRLRYCINSLSLSLERENEEEENAIE